MIHKEESPVSEKDANEPRADGLLAWIDDPLGLRNTMPDDEKNTRAGAYFVERVQDMRWELWALLIDLDNTQRPTDATTMLVPQVIDLLGVVARAEAAYHDDPEHDPAAVLFDTERDRPRSEDV